MKFIHTLAVPEHIWMDFFRVFFSQRYLLVDEDGDVIENRFHFDESLEPANRSFDILFESDLTGANPNILPALVIEDTGIAQSGILLNQLKTWTVSPESTRDRADLMRSMYVFHCCSRTRGESRLLASIVGSAVTAFRDAILAAGLHKIEPWSIGKSQPLRADNDEVYIDTPLTVSFSFQEGWKTRESYAGHFRQYCLSVAGDSLSAFVRAVMDIVNRDVAGFLMSSMFIETTNTEDFVMSSLDTVNPLTADKFVLSSLTLSDPLSASPFIRSSMRVS